MGDSYDNDNDAVSAAERHSQHMKELDKIGKFIVVCAFILLACIVVVIIILAERFISWII